MNRNLNFTLAQRYFEQATALFAREGGRMWGISLDGPLIFVDHNTL